MTSLAVDPGDLRADALLDKQMARLMTQAFEQLAISTAYIVGQIDETDLSYAGLATLDVDGIVTRAAAYAKQVLTSATELDVTITDAWRQDWEEATGGR